MDPLKTPSVTHSGLPHAPRERVDTDRLAFTVPAEPPPKSTPFVARSIRANVGGLVEKHDVMDQSLAGESHDACFRGLTNFEGGKLTDAAIGFNPANILPEILQGDAPLRKVDTKTRQMCWVDWPGALIPDDKSGSREKAIAKCMNRVGHAIAKSLGQKDAPRKWTAKHCNTPLPRGRFKLKPDLVLMSAKDANSEDTSKIWTRIFAVGGLQSGASSGKSIKKLAHRARLIFGEQPDRRHVLAFSIREDTLFYVLFNRSGAFASDEFNVHDYPERFIRVVVGMMFAGREAIGFDPSMKLTVFDKTEPFEPYTEVEKTKFTIVEVLHVEKVIRGRATAVYKVKRPKADANGKDEYLVVKNGWVDSRQKKESDILMELSDVPYIPRVVAYQISDDEATSKAEFDEWRDRNPESTVDIEGMAERMECRKEVRVAMAPVGASIADFRSLKELVHVFITIVDAIAALHDKKYLHRDISVRNVLIDDSSEGENGLRNGLLIDFDYAIPDDLNREVNGLHRTGTIPYMATELLRELNAVMHGFYHDLESLFYVMCYICCVCAGPNYTLRKDINIFHTAIAKWFGKENHTEKEIGEAKYRTVTPRANFQRYILSVFHPYFNPLKPYFLRLSALAVPPEERDIQMYWDYSNGGIEDYNALPFNLQPMQMRARKQITEYRAILKQAFDILPDKDPEPGDVTGSSTQGSSPQTNADESIRSPMKRTLPPPSEVSDTPLRLMDLVPREVGTDSQKEQKDDSEPQNEGSATLLGKESGGSRSGKRKSAVLEDDEPEDDEGGDLLSPTPVSKGGRIRDNRQLGNSGLRSLTALSTSSKTPLDPIAEAPGIEGPAEISVGVRRSGSKGTERLKTQEELDG